ASAKGAPAFGLLLIVAASTGVEELGTNVFAAAFAFVEKGQNAFACFGKNVMKKATTINPARNKAKCSST
ncbi:MAG: hypothetical protein KGJ31_03300, partial [Patescibacteria group bacterium]|nr:hypothetical protein [Patescibacteria group bacterium]